MELGGAPIVSAPAALVPGLRAAAAAWPGGTVRDPGRVCAALDALGAAAGPVIGPAYLGYTDAAHFTPAAPAAAVRALGPGDEGALAALRAACAPDEWEHGGSDPAAGPAAGPVVGAFADGGLAAVAGYEVWGGRLAHIAVVTHPRQRGRGHGAAAVSALVRSALGAGLVPQYRTLEANRSSAAIARRLGFVPYAVSLAVRLGAAGA
jgi:GNAT superfamily N-acetyltransferase